MCSVHNLFPLFHDILNSKNKGGEENQNGVTAGFPVLVFFHGGSFQEGGSNFYGGKYFMEENVVLVSVNYRLGALGS